MINSNQYMKALFGSGKNPRQIAMQLLGNTNNPIINNLVSMAQNGDYKGVETIARNILKEQGRDYDLEMKNMKELINSFK